MSSRFGFLSKVFGGSETLAKLEQAFDKFGVDRSPIRDDRGRYWSPKLSVECEDRTRITMVAGAKFYDDAGKHVHIYSAPQKSVLMEQTRTFRSVDVQAPELEKYRTGMGAIAAPLSVIAKFIDKHGGIRVSGSGEDYITLGKEYIADITDF